MISRLLQKRIYSVYQGRAIRAVSYYGSNQTANGIRLNQGYEAKSCSGSSGTQAAYPTTLSFRAIGVNGCHKASKGLLSRKFCTNLKLPNEISVSDSKLSETEISLRILRLVQAFRLRGHFAASLDPLTPTALKHNVVRKAAWLPDDPEQQPDIVKLLASYPSLNLIPFGLENVDIDQLFYIGNEVEVHPTEQREYYSIRQLVNQMRKFYCGNVGVEISHIEVNRQKEWLVREFGTRYGSMNWSVSKGKESKLKIFKQLLESDITSQFFNKKFPSTKVFGLEGCESLIPGLYSVLETSCQLGVEGIEMGMPHRGRMNVLRNIFRIPLSSICNKFSETEINELGDVKYHLGNRAELCIQGDDGIDRKMHLSLAANPSHLESVNAVVYGKTKAKQFYINDIGRKKVMLIMNTFLNIG
jgi:2-oxoglutarate dehydrogenase E1 component